MGGGGSRSCEEVSLPLKYSTSSIMGVVRARRAIKNTIRLGNILHRNKNIA